MKKGVQSMDLALQGLRLEVMSSDQACLLVHCPDNDYVPLCACMRVCVAVHFKKHLVLHLAARFL